MSDFTSVGSYYQPLVTGKDKFSEENIEKSFYNVIFPKNKYQGSFDMFQKRTKLNPKARFANEDERRLLDFERSVGRALALENQG